MPLRISDSPIHGLGSDAVLSKLTSLRIQTYDQFLPHVLEYKPRHNLERFLGIEITPDMLHVLVARATPLAGASRRAAGGGLIPPILAGAAPLPPTAASPFIVGNGLPSRVDLSSRFLPVRDQGPSRSTCVGFAVTAAAECVTNRADYYSAEHLYYACKMRDVPPSDTQCGTLISTATAELPAGLCDEPDWVYNPNLSPCPDHHGPPPPGLARSAIAARGTALRAGDLFGVKSALASGRPVVCNVQYFSWWMTNPDYDSGEITSPSPFDMSIYGHAICFVGYEDDAAPAEQGDGVLLFRNSWGTNFGATGWKPGYGKLGYRYIVGYPSMNVGPFAFEIASIA